MTDKNVAWAITQIEAAMAKAVSNRDYYFAAINDPKNRNAHSYLAFAQRMRQKWAGKVYGLEAARQILEQVGGEADG